MMVFVPVAPTVALALRDGERLSAGGFAATPTLRRALGSGSDDEEADFVALNTAGVAALDGLAGVRRLVLAVDVDEQQVTDRRTDLGEVEVRDLGWRQVQALFADEEPAGPALAAAAAAASGVPLGEAFELPAVVGAHRRLRPAVVRAGRARRVALTRRDDSATPLPLSAGSGRLTPCHAQSGREPSPSDWSRFR